MPWIITIFFSYTRTRTGFELWVSFQPALLSWISCISFLILSPLSANRDLPASALLTWPNFVNGICVWQCASHGVVNYWHVYTQPLWFCCSLWASPWLFLTPKATVGSALPITALFSLLGIILSWSGNRNGCQTCCQGISKISFFLGKEEIGANATAIKAIV